MRSVVVSCFAALLSIGGPAAVAATDVQTIVLIRHGEKPSAGLGQLDCRGLNRSLALPGVIGARFGRPDAVFAPDPAHAKPDHIRSYDYVRPLATVEPTAISFGLPVNTQFGYADTDALAGELERPRWRSSLLLVAWEHVELVKLARRLLADAGGNAGQVPGWAYGDYDGIYVIRISRGSDGVRASFERQQQHLDGQSTQCPGPRAPSPSGDPALPAPAPAPAAS